MSVITFGIDPGTSTGMVVMMHHVVMGVWQESPDRAVPRFKRLLEAYTLDPDNDVQVGIERFIVSKETGKKSQQPTALQVIGAVEYECAARNVTMHLQTVADVKKMMPNTRLRALGLWTTSAQVYQHDANDANDAMRHALYCIATNRATLFAELLRQAVVR